MEIQMLKFNNSFVLKKRFENYLIKAIDIDPAFKESTKICNNYSFEDKLIYYESTIFDIFDLEAFPNYMNSPYFQKLEAKFNQIRCSYYKNIN